MKTLLAIRGLEGAENDAILMGAPIVYLGLAAALLVALVLFYKKLR